MNTKKLLKSDYLFFLSLIVLCGLCILLYFDGYIMPQNTTLYAFSYKYGFVPRGLLGTIWRWIDENTGLILMSYHSIYQFSELLLGLFAVALFALYGMIYYRTLEHRKMMRYLIVFFSVFNFPMFAGEHNFGRIDNILMIIAIISCILIIWEKFEWLIPSFCVIAEMFHQGFVFISINIILVLFIYKVFTYEGKKKRYYLVLFVTTFLLTSIAFLYFEFFAKFAPGCADEIISTAKLLSADGATYSESLVNHEVLGMDVFDEEWHLHVINYVETPLFLLLFSPYIVIFIRFFKNLIKECGRTMGERSKYIIVLLGGLTVFPQVILKTDYGRYAYFLVFYYIGVLMCLCALGDEYVSKTIQQMMTAVNEKVPAAKILLAYPLIFMPFYDVFICQAMENFCVNLFGL